MWRRFEVEISGTAVIEFDDSIMPDDEWRSKFYNIHNRLELAEHLAYNFAVNGATLSRLDGWADEDDSLAELISIDWDMDDTIETTDTAPYPKHSEHIK